ncbi:MAG: hypothetical protein J3K34DRAFT_284408 [Monoraphidium minutum]|nr:MAG: hypothetical protein J3K34DRAFT_284408 [Monoraphidium minutum]
MQPLQSGRETGCEGAGRARRGGRGRSGEKGPPPPENCRFVLEGARVVVVKEVRCTRGGRGAGHAGPRARAVLGCLSLCVKAIGRSPQRGAARRGRRGRTPSGAQGGACGTWRAARGAQQGGAQAGRGAARIPSCSAGSVHGPARPRRGRRAGRWPGPPRARRARCVRAPGGPWQAPENARGS